MGLLQGEFDRTSSLPNGPEYRTKYWKMIDILEIDSLQND